MMEKLAHILGIDIGTSSLKLLYHDGRALRKVRVPYEAAGVKGWWDAVCAGAKQLDLRELRGIGLSSQVGTYIVDDGWVIGWQDGAGREELAEVLANVSRDECIRELNMPHPELASYPLPRLLYIKKHDPDFQTVCQPKDFICQRLTGKRLGDQFSYRGIANLDTCSYSTALLERFGLCASVLPPLAEPLSVAGHITAEAALATGIPEGAPVVLGCNDFFAGLLGMGIWECGDAFDIGGTSEHLGLLREELPTENDRLVSGAYFRQNVHYGVTASSGCSMDFGLSLANFAALSPSECLAQKPPIFLPYLTGERAPIWDPNARGVFFGIEKGCTKEALAYAVAEGVCFSLYQIYDTMNKPRLRSLTVSGGAGKDRLMNELKATLFNCPVRVLEENDASGYGAQLLAAVGIGVYSDLSAAIAENVKVSETVLPKPALQQELYRRFERYRALYPALKQQFEGLL